MPTWTKEQLEAIEKDGTNIIVSAGAGSGKTAVLSERVLYKLEKGIHINEFLILTFTRAAADEMKDRIRKKIKKNDTLKQELNLIDSSYITTFDSFALSIVKKYHYLLNIPKSIGITDASIVNIYKDKCLNSVFELLYENEDHEFEEFIKKYCIKNDTLMRNYILNLANRIENYLDKDAFLNYAKNTFFSDTNIQAVICDFMQIVDSHKEKILMELENCRLAFDSNYISKIEEVLMPVLNETDYDKMVQYSKCSLPNVPKGTTDEGKESKAKLKTAIDDLFELFEFGNKDLLRASIISTRDDVKVIVNILTKYFTRLSDTKRELGLYTFQDIALLAINIVKEYSDIRNNLKNSFKEIMIDEYQDTNDIQETFIQLISNHNVYMVGDIKQSIYRFRGSNPDIFKNKYDDYSLLHDGYKIDLIKNFRSRSEVLDNINKIFELIMDNKLGGAEYYESHEMVYGQTSYTSESLPAYNYDFETLQYDNPKESDYKDSEVEIFTIANDIKNKLNSGFQVFDKETSKLRKATYSDFVIILDRSKYFDLYKKIFESLNIPLTILKDDKLINNNDLNIIKNIINLIIKINDNVFDTDFKYSFISIARSFLYEYTDEYIFHVFMTNTFKNTSIYNDFKNIDSFNSKTPQMIFNDIITITDFYNKIYKIGDYENINVRISKINDMANDINELGMTIYDFKDYLDEILEKEYDINYSAYNSGTDSVKILTIHKSKGLEYPVCYFADLDHEFNLSEFKDKFIVDAKYGLICPINAQFGEKSVVKHIYQRNCLEAEIGEKIRLFYVALTRAREKIIIVLPNKEVSKLEKNYNGTIKYIRRLEFKKLSDLIYAVKPYLENYFITIDVSKIGMSKNYLYSKFSNNNILNDKTEDFNVDNIKVETIPLISKSFSKKRNNIMSKQEIKNINFGKQIHEVLEYTDFKNFNKDSIKDEFIRNKIIAFLNCPVMRDINNAKIYQEYEFIYFVNETEYHGIIDLLIEHENRIDIIDYKLNDITDDAYLKQLNGYKTYIEHVTKKKTNIYLYSLLEEKLKQL